MVKLNSTFFKKPSNVNLVLLSVSSLLFVAKLIFAYISNSLALLADAFDSLTDIVMAVVALVGLIYSNKKPNEKFPYGYYKIENIISLIIAIFIFITAYNVIVQAFTDFYSIFSGQEKIITVSLEIIIFLISSLLISVILTFYLKVVGKKAESPIISSQASEKLYDNFISASVIISFIGAIFNIILFDSIIGLIIAVFIIKGGYDIFISSTKTLLDAVIDFENRTELYNLIQNHPKVKKVEKLEIRAYGKYIIVEATIQLNKNLQLYQIQALKKGIAADVTSKYPRIFRILIFIQTPEITIIKFAVPLENNNDLDSRISEHYGESPFFAIIEIRVVKTNKTLEGYTILSNKYKDVEKRKGILISDWLTSFKIDKIYLKTELKMGPKLIFENSLTQTEITSFEVLNQIISKELKTNL